MNFQDKLYKIEVSLSSGQNYIHKPYYWILWGNENGNWANECCGWANTPEKAWKEAIIFYNSLKK